MCHEEVSRWKKENSVRQRGRGQHMGVVKIRTEKTENKGDSEDAHVPGRSYSLIFGHPRNSNNRLKKQDKAFTARVMILKGPAVVMQTVE